MERIFQISAVILAGIAAYFLWNDNGDGAFVAAVLGAVSFFLSIRFQVKGRMKIREEEEEAKRMLAGMENANFPALEEEFETEINPISQPRATDRERL